MQREHTNLLVGQLTTQFGEMEKYVAQINRKRELEELFSRTVVLKSYIERTEKKGQRPNFQDYRQREHD